MKNIREQALARKKFDLRKLVETRDESQDTLEALKEERRLKKTVEDSKPSEGQVQTFDLKENISSLEKKLVDLDDAIKEEEKNLFDEKEKLKKDIFLEEIEEPLVWFLQGEGKNDAYETFNALKERFEQSGQEDRSAEEICEKFFEESNMQELYKPCMEFLEQERQKEKRSVGGGWSEDGEEVSAIDTAEKYKLVESFQKAAEKNLKDKAIAQKKLDKTLLTQKNKSQVLFAVQNGKITPPVRRLGMGDRFFDLPKIHPKNLSFSTPKLEDKKQHILNETVDIDAKQKQVAAKK